MIKVSACILMVAILFMAGCSTTPRRVDLPLLTYSSSEASQKDARVIKEARIVSRAKDAEQVNAVFENTLVPVNVEPSPKQTVEKDIREYLSNVMTVSEDANKKLIVTITRADSYWVLGGLIKVPVLGLLAVGADTDFVLNLKVLFEIEENGKVIRSYGFEDRIVLRDGKAATEDHIIESYQRLIALYRNTFFGLLDREFISRYL